MKGRKVRHQAKRVNLCLRAFGDRNIRVGSWIGAISISCFWSRKTEWRAGLAAFSPFWTRSPGPSSSKIPGLGQLWARGPLTMENLCFTLPLSILILQWRWAAKPFPQGNSPLDNTWVRTDRWSGEVGLASLCQEMNGDNSWWFWAHIPSQIFWVEGTDQEGLVKRLLVSGQSVGTWYQKKWNDKGDRDTLMLLTAF